MTSRAARRSAAKRRKQAGISLPGEPPAEQVQRQPDGRVKPEDPRKTALTARAKRAGIPDWKDAARQILATDMGLCINALATKEELPDLTETWAAISAAWRNHRLLVIGQTGDPQGASIGMVPDKMETDPSLRVDLRTTEERVASAKASKAKWDAKLAALPTPFHRWAIRGALEGFMGEARLWRDRKPTTEGALAIEALRMVAK
jgi:hypothetical protein